MKMWTKSQTSQVLVNILAWQQSGLYWSATMVRSPAVDITGNERSVELKCYRSPQSHSHDLIKC